MPFDPGDFRKLALWLVEQRSDESSLRTAISRTYYAGHHLAVDRLKQKRNWSPTGTGRDHIEVIRQLKPGKTSGISNYLDELRMLREHADYHLESSESVSNRGCSFCKKIRESAPTGAPNVTMGHWQNAKEVSDRCFSLLAKL